MAWADPADPDTRVFTIVGVVGDTRHDGLDAAPRAEAYVPLVQSPVPYFWIVAYGSLGRDQTTKAIRSAVSSVDPGRPISSVQPLDEVLQWSLSRPRFAAVVLVTFAVLALMMAALGLYAVLAWSVSSRTREIGIRMALGAPRLSVVADVLGDGGRLVAIGLAIGLIGSVATSRVIAGQRHGARVVDPISTAVCVVTLAAAATLASLLPALRASRVDPAVSLQSDL